MRARWRSSESESRLVVAQGGVECFVDFERISLLVSVVCDGGVSGRLQSLDSISIKAEARNSGMSLGEAVRVCIEADELYSEGEDGCGIQKEGKKGLHFASRDYL